MSPWGVICGGFSPGSAVMFDIYAADRRHVPDQSKARPTQWRVFLLERENCLTGWRLGDGGAFRPSDRWMFFGIFSPSEAAAIGAFGSFVLITVRRQLKRSVLVISLMRSVRITCA